MRTIRILFAIGLLGMALSNVGCEEEGPAERAGKKIDSAVDKAGDAVEDAGDKVEDAVD